TSSSFSHVNLPYAFENYTLSLHDALPIFLLENSMSKAIQLIKEFDVKWVDLRFTDTKGKQQHVSMPARDINEDFFEEGKMFDGRSEEHTSELQSRENLVCRLLLEKKKTRQ